MLKLVQLEAQINMSYEVQMEAGNSSSERLHYSLSEFLN